MAKFRIQIVSWFLTLVGVVAFTVTGCKKESDDPTDIVVTVLTDEGQRVPFANITFQCESTINRPCELVIERVTNEIGVYERRFSEPKVLRINAYKIVADTLIVGIPPNTYPQITRDSLCGEAYITIREFATSRQTVVLSVCN